VALLLVGGVGVIAGASLLGRERAVGMASDAGPDAGALVVPVLTGADAGTTMGGSIAPPATVSAKPVTPPSPQPRPSPTPAPSPQPVPPPPQVDAGAATASCYCGDFFGRALCVKPRTPS